MTPTEALLEELLLLELKFLSTGLTVSVGSMVFMIFELLFWIIWEPESLWTVVRFCVARFPTDCLARMTLAEYPEEAMVCSLFKVDDPDTGGNYCGWLNLIL